MSERSKPEVVDACLGDDGTFPNSELPLLHYKGALDLPDGDPAAMIERTFDGHGWGGSWRNGVYAFHHYHSTAHEALGCYAGSARIELGGPGGIVAEVQRGDVVVIPAGVAHKNLSQTPDFRVVGAYPRGQRPDMCYGEAGERPAADERIAQVPLPGMDPVSGAKGALIEEWAA